MKRKLLKAGFAVLTAFLLTFSIIALNEQPELRTSAKTLQENRDEVRRLEDNLSSKQNDIAELERQIQEAKADVQRQASVKQMLDEQIVMIRDEIAISEELIVEYELQIQYKDVEISELLTQIEETATVIDERLVVQHEMGNSSIISFILSSKDIGEMFRRIEIANELFEYDQEILDKLSDDLETVEGAKAELEALRQKCEESRQTLSAKETELQTLSDEAYQYLNELKKNEDFLENSKAAIEAEFNNIQNEIKALERQIEAQERKNYSNGEFIFPLDPDIWYVNTGGFGWRYWANNSRPTDYHRGVDFATGYGNPIIAVQSGTVTISRYSPSFGNYVVIDHGGGVSSLYAHASQRLVEVGDQVVQGDVIAKVGSTGDSTGNHLHFSILKNGEYVDPMNYISEP